MHATTRWVAFGSAVVVILGGLATSARAAEPEGQPVKWDQARVTKYAVDLDDAVENAVQQMRKNPIQVAAGQRTSWYDLKEDLRLISNSSEKLRQDLQGGATAEETRATFDRLGSLRRDAEEDGRKSEIPAPVMDALVKAGSIHNLMQPYYHGKR
jgi:hypothetical protein